MTFQPHPDRAATIETARKRLTAVNSYEAVRLHNAFEDYEGGARNTHTLDVLDMTEALLGATDDKRALTDAVNATYNRQPDLQQQPRTDEDAAWDAEIDAAAARDEIRAAVAPRLGELFDKTELHGVPDPVNHPQHYTSHPSGIEAIQVTEHFTFCVGNAIKYLWRAGQKGDAIQDLEKSAWYVQREIARLKAQQR